MNLWAYATIILGGGFIFLAHWWFVLNTKYEGYDYMGASINFDQPFGVGALLVSMGIHIGGLLPWYLCILFFVVLEISSLPYKWKLLDPIVGRFRKPNPSNQNSEQGSAHQPTTGNQKEAD